jgi:hypothetical protein
MPKVIRKLTEKEIQAAKPQEKPYKLYDEGGLLLLVRPSGTKVWQYPYKLNDKYNVLTIGQYGSTPDRGNKNNRDSGLAEYTKICKFVVDSDFFMGADYSDGDTCIEECSKRPKSTSNAGIGGPQQWIERGTNHHITKVVNDLSSLFAS